ncbi:hypothetical protein OJ996_03615 [Luteolibacter sp. GHJ8]|uniref:Uncharacterized protein n=1 Tax=Luteolibacter rhizosphaerae TaxID=2989719 RepID=A0ABT3FYJ8_9BACT|nr:hypothetical protein [Luteolibacter rhizosphaerae]MCW1912648.1 hypothetical protein [Luteolibacter rhizosphaerae]
MLEEILTVLLVCGVPAALVFHGWKKGGPIDRLEFLRDCIGVAVTSFVAAAFRDGAGVVVTLAAWIGSALWMFRSLGRRLKDARVPAWLVWVMGAAGITGVPYLIALLLPSQMLKEAAAQETNRLESTAHPEPEPAMKHSHYSVHIPEGEELSEGYVSMAHGSPYTIRLENGGQRRCDAKVEIDGHDVGTWRVNARDFVVLERPAHDTGRFTFFKVGTAEGARAGIVKNEKTGLISVTFIPESSPYSGGLCAAPLSDDNEAGGTGLTGESAQKFGTAEAIERAENEAFTIHLRLVAKPEFIRPLIPRSTPIPPPIGT